MERSKPLLRSLVPSELDDLVAELAVPRFRADQLRTWLHRQHVLQWDRMSNLPAGLRADLAARFDLAGLEPVERQVSSDGTRKFLFRLRDGSTVESVIIPMTEHPTFCISSQVGVICFLPLVTCIETCSHPKPSLATAKMFPRSHLIMKAPLFPFRCVVPMPP